MLSPLRTLTVLSEASEVLPAEILPAKLEVAFVNVVVFNSVAIIVPVTVTESASNPLNTAAPSLKTASSKNVAIPVVAINPP